MYRRRYGVKEIIRIMEELLLEGRQYIDFEDLDYNIGFDVLDVNEFYTKNIKHRIRYERVD